jgi:Fe-S-cluster containining protein
LNIHFNCTQCANCCHHTKIPVTVAEAIEWLNDGHQVQIICEASPWMPPDGMKTDYLVRRSFPARSGAMSVRVAVSLVANLNGQCPNLLADKRCGIYERRPLVCRIYPAEINPFTQLDPTKKACPSEAWGTEHPLLLRNNRIASQSIEDDIKRWRALNELDVHVKRKVCAALNLVSAAIDREGFFIHSPPTDDLMEVLSLLKDETDAGTSQMPWLLVSDRAETLERLTQAGATAAHPREVKAGLHEYIGLKR